jgi:regulator of protease activity HflC (stomatin/prohibitin superfamily)
VTVGELLKQVLDWIYTFWPARLVHDWEQGVRCLFGRATTRLTSSNGVFGTGLHFFWPVVGRIITDETNIEVVETDLQTLTTRDGVPVTFSLGLKYRISNLVRMYKSIHDARETLYNEITAVAGSLVPQLEYEAVRDELCKLVIHETKEQMGEWGIEIISLNLINLCEAQPIRLIANRGIAPRRPDTQG